jgi:hypothetical protein
VPDGTRVSSSNSNENESLACSPNDCIHLAACQVNELLPMNPELPADLFTSCLTTPIKIALRWYVFMFLVCVKYSIIWRSSVGVSF